MYLSRKIDDYLHAWKSSDNKKPLIIKGARQVGKTKSILEFSHASYENTVYINFVIEPKFMTILSDGYSAESIIKNISLIEPSFRFIPGKTLIIFDELQQNPDIATSLKSFCIDSRFDVICSGSLLETHYKKIHSNSVGYKIDYEMHSMDFEEFLWAMKYHDLSESILKKMLLCTPFSITEMSVIKNLFTEYCILGGMPEVVLNFIEKKVFPVRLKFRNRFSWVMKKISESMLKALIKQKSSVSTEAFRLSLERKTRNSSSAKSKMEPEAENIQDASSGSWILE